MAFALTPIAKFVIIGLGAGIAFFAIVSALSNPWTISFVNPPHLLPIDNQDTQIGQPGFISQTQQAELLDRLSGSNVSYSLITNEEQPDRNQTIALSRSIANGAYSTPLVISNPKVFSIAPVMAYSNSNVYVVWQELANQTNPVNYYQLHYAVSHDYGATFSKDIDISNTTQFASEPQLIAANDTVFLVWNAQSVTPYQNLMRYSSDFGKTFSKIYNISESTRSTSSPVVGYANNQLFVAWHERDNDTSSIIFRKINFERYGDNFVVSNMSNKVQLSGYDSLSSDPQIATSNDGQDVYVAWIDVQRPPSPVKTYSPYYSGPPVPQEVMFRSSNDGGATWGNTWNIGSKNPISGLFKLGANGKIVHLVWLGQASTPNYNVYYRRSLDAGQTFGPPFQVSREPADFTLNSKVSEGIVYISWFERSPSIAFVISYDNGTKFRNSIYH